MRDGTWKQAGRTTLALALVAIFAPAGAQAASADLAITNADSPDPVTKGQELTYTLTVTNQGPGIASNVTATDNLDNHLDFISAAPSQGSCTQKGRKITCALGTIQPAGGPYTEYTESVTVTIKVRPTKTGQLTNDATVATGSGDTDPNSANNGATATTTVVAAGGGGGGPRPTCAGLTATIVGTGGADTLTGTGRRDVIKARGGNDVIRGLRRHDVVCAGGGNDTLKGGGGGDRLKGGTGADLLKGGSGSDDLLGGPGNDQCRGGPGRDTKVSC